MDEPMVPAAVLIEIRRQLADLQSTISALTAHLIKKDEEIERLKQLLLNARRARFGQSSDRTTVGDLTGDGKADVAFWRPSTGEWYVLRSENSTFYAFPFGTNGDTPAPGDYDGDGKMDAAVFRPSTSTWYANRSTAGVLIQQFGQTGDLAVPASFVR